MLLQLSTWMEIETYLKTQKALILPIGSTEQHGPTGLIGTDALTAQAIAEKAGEIADALVAPPMMFGMAQHHMAFPGTMTLKPSTLILLYCELMESLYRHGFRRFFFVNGHGGNVPSVHAAFSEFFAQSQDPDLRCRLVNWWDAPGVKEILHSDFGAADGQHATASEIAVTHFLFPDHIKPIPEGGLTPRQAPIGPFYTAQDYRNRFPDGRIGSDPSLANPEKGKKLLEAAAKGVSVLYAKFLDD